MLTLLLGRTFCGQLCPVGSQQELAYAIPCWKWVMYSPVVFDMIRLVVFIGTIVAPLYFINLMAFTGLYDRFSLTVSALVFVVACIILVSVFLYRPVCRIVCHFGVMFFLFVKFSWLRLRRTGACNYCRKYEKPARLILQEKLYIG